MPAIAAVAGAGIQAGVGILQAYKGNEMTKNLSRPKYEIPSAIKDKMTTAEMLQYQGLPEESKQEYIDNLSRNMAFSFQNLDSRKAGIAGTATINQQAMDAEKGLLSADAAQRMQNVQNLQNNRTELAGYQDKQFTFNKANPYYETLNQAEALKGAGMQNFMGAVNTAATAFGNASSQDNKDQSTSTAPSGGA